VPAHASASSQSPVLQNERSWYLLDYLSSLCAAARGARAALTFDSKRSFGRAYRHPRTRPGHATMSSGASGEHAQRRYDVPGLGLPNSRECRPHFVPTVSPTHLGLGRLWAAPRSR